MLNVESKTARIVAAFAAVATTAMFAGCGEEELADEHEEYEDQRLTDDEGVAYTLHRNADGTETARYDDGREVTFRRNGDGSLEHISGLGPLLAGLAAGYFLFHGFSVPYGSYNGSRYVVQEPLKRMTRQEQEKQMSRYSGGSAGSAKSTGSANTEAKSAANGEKTSKSVAGSKAPGTAGSTAGVSKNTSPSATAKSSTSGSSVKSGFGGAGARSASS